MGRFVYPRKMLKTHTHRLNFVDVDVVVVVVVVVGGDVSQILQTPQKKQKTSTTKKCLQNSFNNPSTNASQILPKPFKTILKSVNGPSTILSSCLIWQFPFSPKA